MGCYVIDIDVGIVVWMSQGYPISQISHVMLFHLILGGLKKGGG